MLIELREPCPECESTKGELIVKNGANNVWCSICERYQYCARKDEVAGANEEIKRRPIKSRQKVRILLRDSARCLLCGDTEGPLHVGHLISDKDGPALGLSPEDIRSDENLVTMCQDCNLGLNSDSVTARLIAALIRGK